MTDDDKRDLLIEYLYGEIAPEEKHSFRQELDQDPELSGELKNYLQLREAFHEHLPNHPVPKHLTHKVLRDLGVRRSWLSSFSEGFWRPALVGAMVLAVTLGITSQWKQWWGDTKEVAKVETTPAPAGPAGTLSTPSPLSDPLLANRRFRPILRVPVRGGNPNILAPSPRNMVSLAGYGNGTTLETQTTSPDAEIHRLELEAEQAVAQFIHQQALRMRAMGDFKGAAQHLAYLIKTYPFYPLKLQAMAQRVDSLFRGGEVEQAQKELKVLAELSPTLAFYLQRRWSPTATF
jgi:hypothetical protein